MNAYEAAALSDSMLKQLLREANEQVTQVRQVRGELRVGAAIQEILQVWPEAKMIEFVDAQEPGNTATITLVTGEGAVFFRNDEWFRADGAWFDPQDADVEGAEYLLTGALDDGVTFPLGPDSTFSFLLQIES